MLLHVIQIIAHENKLICEVYICSLPARRVVLTHTHLFLFIRLEHSVSADSSLSVHFYKGCILKHIHVAETNSLVFVVFFLNPFLFESAIQVSISFD